MDAEQRREIESQIRVLHTRRELFLAVGDVPKFNAITGEIATLDRELRNDTDNRKE